MESKEDLAPFRIAIIGGGIGGLSAALFLNHYCNTPDHRPIEVSVYEASEFKESDVGMTLGFNAMRLYANLSEDDRYSPIIKEINAFSGTRTGVWFTFRRFDNGEEIVTVPRGEAEGAPVRMVAVSKAELLDLLLRWVKKNEEVGNRLYEGKKLQFISEVDGQDSALLPSDGSQDKLIRPVKITFEDGTTTEADMVIGCDGMNSAVRRQFIGDQAVYSGKIHYRALIPKDSLPTRWPFETYAVMWNAPGRHFAIYPISKNKTLNIVAGIDKTMEEIPDLRETSFRTCDKSDLEEDFEDFNDPIVKEIIKLMPERLSKWRLDDRKPVGKWAFMDGRVVLLGDAAHPVVPHQSAGAGQAVEDGYILAKALSEYLLIPKPPPPPPEKFRNWWEYASLDGAQPSVPEEENKEPTDLHNPRKELKTWMKLYYSVRLPRATRAHDTGRMVGDLFELMGPSMEGKTFEQRLRVLIRETKYNMKWLWKGDINFAYEEHRAHVCLSAAPYDPDKLTNRWEVY